MNVYADTSFLVALFLPNEERSSLAQETLQSEITVSVTPLSLLELRNSFNLAVVRKKITLQEVEILWEQFEKLQSAGVFLDSAVSHVALFHKARELSDLHSPSLATRSLDLLHVAAAILLEVDVFYTFDERQKSAAVAEGLTVLP